MNDECLFSFEVFVKNIEYVNVCCVIPAISFRLLDYPAVIIYSTKLEDIESMKTKLGGYSQNEVDLFEMEKLWNHNGGFDFYKGKSCLLRHQFTRLNQLLETVPLYITMLDVWCEKPKLIGSCLVPLQNIMSQIKDVFVKCGASSPAQGCFAGKYTINNLMGSSIGKINLEFKLTCFGNSLLQHVSLKERAPESQIDMLLNQPFSDENTDNISKEKLIKGSPQEKEVERSVLPAKGVFLHSTTQKEHEGVQCSTHRNKKKFISSDFHTQDKSIDNTIYNNIIIPPPLYLNLAEPFVQYKAPIDEKSNFVLETDLQSCSSFSDEEPEIEILRPTQTKGRYSVTTMNKITNDDTNSKKQPGKAYCDNDKTMETKNQICSALSSDMPILCSLLKEISALSNKLLSNNIDENNTIKRVGIATQTHSSIQKSPTKSPRQQNYPHIISHERTEKSVDKTGPEVNSSKANTKHKRKGKPQKLKYGLTKTQRLRYELSHKNELLPTNSMELHKLSVNEPSNDHNKSDLTMLSPAHPYFSQSHHNSTSNVLNDLQPIDISAVLEPIESNDTGEMNTLMRSKSQEETANIHANEAGHMKNTLSSLDEPEQENSSKRDASDDVNDSFHNQDIPEKKAGFYSPTEPRSVSLSELGIFDDLSSWQSRSNEPNYADDAFYSDDDVENNNDSITATSSVSLPLVSNATDKSSQHSTIANLDDSPRRLNQQSRRSSAKSTRTNSSFNRSQISSAQSHKSRTHSRTETAELETRSQSKNENKNTYSGSPSEDGVTRTSNSITSSDHTKSGSSRSSDGRKHSNVNAPPIISSHSPVKSKHTRQRKSNGERVGGESVGTLTSSERNV